MKARKEEQKNRQRANQGEDEVDEQDGDVEGEEEESAKGIQALIDSIDEYTDKHMMMSMWSWDPKDVRAGESVGICVRPAE